MERNTHSPLPGARDALREVPVTSMSAQVIRPFRRLNGSIGRRVAQPTIFNGCRSLQTI